MVELEPRGHLRRESAVAGGRPGDVREVGARENILYLGCDPDRSLNQVGGSD